jgi:hypothetical protein
LPGILWPLRILITSHNQNSNPMMMVNVLFTLVAIIIPPVVGSCVFEMCTVMTLST